MAFEERNTADYGFDLAVPAETARRVIESAVSFVRVVTSKLGA